MALFQKTVEQKYLKQLDPALINAKYLEFKSHFGNTDIQENIRNSKEEQYQGEFLIDLFVKILGYTKNPTPNFNLTTEYKNIKDSKKADGAIVLYKGACPLVKAVIELKGTNTTDLSKIEAQAFGYKNNQPDCVYVVTSNFEKLRFYINNAIEYIEFNLFQLSKADFEILYLCLSFESIKNGLPKKVKEESLSQEDVITKKLYQDYSLFKRELHQNLVSLNPQFDSLTLFKKSQKLLDRFLFLFFAEDRHLLPPNSVRLILNDWRDLQERDVEIPLYQRFKKYFEYLNTGYKGKRYDVFAYNGGLFKPDEVLDTILIDDELLFRHTYNLSEYDFDSEIDVNILGHIFENSLNELDELSIETRAHAPLSISRRKKDGVFYTPKYITKYIVENTVGKLCEEKKQQIGIVNEISFERKKNGKLTQKAKDYYALLESYRAWLKQITIIDPACGSGAFLNQSLEFLLNEHGFISNQLQIITGDLSTMFIDIEKSILENNLFGVDLNEESVEIAKLSLWLRTAQPNRKLNDLSNNIKCGNSLIDDPAVAGDKAFNWEHEFQQVFRLKDKKGWHITCATHNSRYSQRMFDYHIELGDAVWLSEKEERIIIETIARIAKEDHLNIVACNVCGDHLHLLLVCEEQEVPKIVGKLKSVSARECNIAMGRTIPAAAGIGTPGHAPLSSSPDAPTSRGTAQAHLWTQKFGCKEITSDEQLENTINYIRNNRVKHGLPELGSSSGSTTTNKGACPLVKDSSRSDTLSPVGNFCCSPEYAFRPENTGGFDVVIGNPPYVHLEKMKDISEALSKMNYKTFDKRGDLYCLFVEHGFNILKQNGIISYIMPNKWLQAGYGKPLREYFLKHEINQLIDFGDIQIFEGATTYPCIFVSRNAKPKTEFAVSVLAEANKDDFYANVEQTAEIFKVDQFSGETWVVSSGKEQQLIERLKVGFKILSDFIGGEAYRGVLTGLTEAFLIDESTKNKLIYDDPKAAKIIKPVLRGRDINKWTVASHDCYLIGTFPALNLYIDEFPSIKKYLLDFGKERLEQSGAKGSRKKTNNKWFETQDTIAYWREFSKPKIMYQKFQVKPCFIYDESGLYCNDSMWIIPTNNKGLLAILNSKMGWWLITKYCTQIQNGCQLIWKYFGQIPVPTTNEDLADKAEQMLSLTNQLQETSQKFQRNIQREFNLEKLSAKLENWFQTPFNEFLKELEKSKVKLTLSQKAKWEDYFVQESKKALKIKHQIDATDKEIDRMVYELYGLSEEEIKIVEG